MLNIPSTNEAVFRSQGDEGLEIDESAERPDRAGRNPLFSVETLMEGRSAYEAIFEDATPFLRR